MMVFWRALIGLAILGVILLSQGWGLLVPADRALRDARFLLSDRPSSAQTLFVELDATSLAEIGVWPWPRRLHGQLLDTLMAAGADTVAFDVDFSTRTTTAEDRAFAQALERAGGYAVLAAFQQRSATSGRIVDSVPIPPFAEQADAGLVNVYADADRRVERLPASALLAGEVVNALPLVMLGQSPQRSVLDIDFSIDLATIERISAADILAGRFDPARIAGRLVVIGASAIELHDFFTVPRFGLVPGPLVQLAAVETLLLERLIVDWGAAPGLIVAGLLVLLTVLAGRRVSVSVFVLAGALLLVALEATALVLFDRLAIRIDTASVGFALALLLGARFWLDAREHIAAHRRERRRRLSMQRILDQVIADNFDGVVIVDETGVIRAASRAAGHLLGIGTALVDRAITCLPTPLVALAEETPSAPVERTVSVRGEERVFECVATRSLVPGATEKVDAGFVTCLTFTDVTESRAARARLDYLARHDEETGALNRSHFLAMIEARIAIDDAVTVVAIGAGRLELINGSLGHATADQVRRRLVDRLSASIGQPVARIGSDRFALILEGGATDNQLETAAILKRANTSYPLEGHAAVIDCTAGTARPEPGEDAVTVLRHAETALGLALEAGKPLLAYRHDHGRHIEERRRLDAALRRALSRDEFHLLYQPQVDLKTGALVGAEALIRWQSSELGEVPPTAFIGLAEETGLILEIGTWALRRAMSEASAYAFPGRLAVNVSALQLQRSDLVGLLPTLSRQTRFPLDRLVLEITESLFMGDDRQVVETCQDLRTLGCAIAIDDFGTGFSSLSYLARLPADKLKIDRSFVRAMSSSDADFAVLETIAQLGTRLGKLIVAEGIENEDDHQALKALEIGWGQGYHYGRPMPMSALVARDTPGPVQSAENLRTGFTRH